MTRGNRRFMATIIMILICIFVWLVVFLPPYEKIVYSQSTICEYDDIDPDSYGYEGYRGGASVPVLDASDPSQEVTHNVNNYFVLKINAKNLEPLHIYRKTSYDSNYKTYETNPFKVFFLRTIEGYAQYYMATLESGQQIPVLINDRVVHIPHSGEIVLPIGSISTDSNLLKMGNEKLEDEWYINTINGFERSHEIKQFYDNRTMVAAGLWVIACMGVIIGLIVIQVRTKKG